MVKGVFSVLRCYGITVLRNLALTVVFSLFAGHFSLSTAQELLVPAARLVPGARCLPHAVKSGSDAVGLPFFDDFSGRQGVPAAALWQQSSAMVSDGARLRPPTVGVVTLDALDAEGFLHPSASTSLFPADTLLSRPLRLDSLTVDDSVVLSFYYLPGGGWGNQWERVGDAPNPQDSLMLDFFRPADSIWVTVWRCAGTTVDSLLVITGKAWQYVTVTIDDGAFFDSAFCFRFRNYCSMPLTAKEGLSSNCDFWHLDYIYVDAHRSASAAPRFHDVAFVDPAQSMLHALRAMPARQYRTQDMVDSLHMTITNLYNTPLATQYDYAVLDESGDTLFFYDGGYENAPPYLPDGEYQTAYAHAAPPVNYAFPESDSPAVYTVVHTVCEGVGGDDHRTNDTVIYRQVFDNYYAYDDGTAENGYGLTSTASRLSLAYRFDLRVADTLTAVDLFFNSTLDGENEAVPFLLSVWTMTDGGYPGTLLYRDASSRLPQIDGIDGFHRYRLERPLTLQGSVFIGFEQTNNLYINLGFDRSNNTADRIYYLTGSYWQQSILSGSLMMRPYFGSSAIVGLAEGSLDSREWKVFPNPSADKVTVEGLPEGTVFVLYDYMGRQVLSSSHPSFMVSHIPAGVYLLRCVTIENDNITTKLVIAR